MKALAPVDTTSLVQRIKTGSTPVLFDGTGYKRKKFWEFFATQIANPNTRFVYLRACYDFADWIAPAGIELEDVEPHMIGAYVHHLGERLSAPSIKLYMAGLRQLFDFLVMQQIITMNPAKSVKTPKHVVKEGSTPILTTEEMRMLFDSIKLDSICAFRDRAIIATMAYSFARVSAVTKLDVSDYYTQSKRSYFILQEKGGVQNKVPAHHTAQLYVDEYLMQFPLADVGRKLPLFRTMQLDRKTLSDKRLLTNTILRMVKRRCRQAGLPAEICNHSFRGTGITTYMSNGGTLETAAKIAGHASTTTTQLYDRRNAEIALDEIERIRY